MKRSIIIAFAFLISITSLLAQKNMDNPKVQEMRKEFYGKKLQFTAEESEAFWPLFNNYQKDEKKLKKKYKVGADVGIMSDSEAEKHLENMVEFEEKKAALKKDYVNQFKTVLPVRKVAMLDKTERQFKQNLLKKYKQRQGGKRPGRN